MSKVFSEESIQYWNKIEISNNIENPYTRVIKLYNDHNIEEIKLKDSLIEIWRKDDKKNFNPQDDCYEFSNIETKKILHWIDKKDTTTFKRKILVESLCYRLDDLISEGNSNDERQLLIIELQKRKGLIKDNLDLLDSGTKKVILKHLQEN